MLWDSQGYIVSNYNEINSRDDENSVGKTSRKWGVPDTRGVLTVLPLVSVGNGLAGNMWTSERAIRKSTMGRLYLMYLRARQCLESGKTRKCGEQAVRNKQAQDHLNIQDKDTGLGFFLSSK